MFFFPLDTSQIQFTILGTRITSDFTVNFRGRIKDITPPARAVEMMPNALTPDTQEVSTVGLIRAKQTNSVYRE